MTKRKGFTLVEILVALTLFSIIIAIAMGSFARALHAQKQASSLIAVQSDAGATLEEMAREMRTGYLFCTTPASTVGSPTPWTSATKPDCEFAADGVTPTCVASSTAGIPEPWTCAGFLHFYDSFGNSVSYSLSNGAIMRNGSQFTSSDVRVNSLTFVLYGQLLGDNWNPRITIAMNIGPSSTDAAIASDTIKLETTVSARQADVYPSIGY